MSLSRPKPPRAVPEGQPLQGHATRPPSATEADGWPAFTGGRWGQPEYLTCVLGLYAPHVGGFTPPATLGPVHTGPGGHALQSRRGRVGGPAEDRRPAE